MSLRELLAVQDLDVKIDQLRHRKDHDPLVTELADAQKAVDAATAALKTKASARQAIEDRRAEIDAEVVEIRTKRADVEAKLYDGSVTATKDLMALQEESAMLLARRNEFEDRELEVMEELEAADTEISAEQDSIDARSVHRDDLAVRLVALRAELDVEIDAVAHDREQAASVIDSSILDRYESLRPEFGGSPLARFEAGTCRGCNLALSAVDVDRIGKQPAEAEVLCPSCGRMLIR